MSIRVRVRDLELGFDRRKSTGRSTRTQGASPDALEAARHERSSRENEKACGVGCGGRPDIIHDPRFRWRNVFVLLDETD